MWLSSLLEMMVNMICRTYCHIPATTNAVYIINIICVYMYMCVCVCPSFLGGSMVKNLPASVKYLGGAGSVPGSGRSPEGGNGKPLQYSCLENLMDRRAWWATVHGVSKNQA